MAPEDEPGLTARERFKAICRGEQPDYVPIFSFPGAPGMGYFAMGQLRVALLEGGMPESVGAGKDKEAERSWDRYWGTTGPVYPSFGMAQPGPGVSCEAHVEDGWEILEWETGARTRQFADNNNVYAMPEFQVYHVRDRESWEFYRERTAPQGLRPAAKLEADIAAFDPGDRPLAVRVGSPWTTWGLIRDLMGPERACTIMYDDPALAHEIIETGLADFETYTVPLIERLRPDILQATEDICYNHGMLISPKHFEEFCSPYYRRVAEVARDCGVDMLAVDTDGNAMEFVSVAERAGINAVFPFEAKAGNDLLALRARYPEVILMGWLEKEVVNAGKGDLIEPEIMSKVPPLLAHGRYFPNGDHCIQPLVDFANLCRFMTLLHQVTRNPEGEFPRLR
jgi:hypothetical protein